MKLLVMQLSPPSRHSIPLWSKYPPQHPVLKHPQFMFLPYCQRDNTSQNSCKPSCRSVLDHQHGPNLWSKGECCLLGCDAVWLLRTGVSEERQFLQEPYDVTPPEGGILISHRMGGWIIDRRFLYLSASFGWVVSLSPFLLYPLG
jgi:hypothetical protein